MNTILTDNIDEANAELVVASEQGRPDQPPCSYDKFCLLGRLDVTCLLTVGRFHLDDGGLLPPILICISSPTVPKDGRLFDCFE
jgi:hypothetical protein